MPAYNNFHSNSRVHRALKIRHVPYAQANSVRAASPRPDPPSPLCNLNKCGVGITAIEAMSRSYNYAAVVRAFMPAYNNPKSNNCAHNTAQPRSSYSMCLASSKSKRSIASSSSSSAGSSSVTLFLIKVSQCLQVARNCGTPQYCAAPCMR